MPQGAPTFTRKPQILQKTSGSDPAIVFDIGFQVFFFKLTVKLLYDKWELIEQADQNPQVIWLNPKAKKMKESSRISFKTYIILNY